MSLAAEEEKAAVVAAVAELRQVEVEVAVVEAGAEVNLEEVIGCITQPDSCIVQALRTSLCIVRVEILAPSGLQRFSIVVSTFFIFFILVVRLLVLDLPGDEVLVGVSSARPESRRRGLVSRRPSKCAHLGTRRRSLTTIWRSRHHVKQQRFIVISIKRDWRIHLTHST